jgi:hypothetical protein
VAFAFGYYPIVRFEQRAHLSSPEELSIKIYTVRHLSDGERDGQVPPHARSINGCVSEALIADHQANCLLSSLFTERYGSNNVREVFGCWPSSRRFLR